MILEIENFERQKFPSLHACLFNDIHESKGQLESSWSFKCVAYPDFSMNFACPNRKTKLPSMRRITRRHPDNAKDA
jgi:hypothetical protein